MGNLCGAKSATQSKNCYFSCKARSFHHRDVVVPSIPFPYLAKEKFAPWKLLESSAFPSFLLYVYWSHVTSRKTKLGALPIAATIYSSWVQNNEAEREVHNLILQLTFGWRRRGGTLGRPHQIWKLSLKPLENCVYYIAGWQRNVFFWCRWVYRILQNQMTFFPFSLSYPFLSFVCLLV